jgi:ABC-type uncharacterized transport system involved in gliding motility auxiliary subunit
MERKAKAATESGILLLIAGGILIALNALSALGGYARTDITMNKRYSLSDGSKRLLKSMKQELKADVYVTKGLPKLDTFVRDLRDLMVEYKAGSGGKFDFTIIEAKTEDQKKAAKEAGLVEQPFGEASDTEEKVGVTQGFMGIVLKYGAEKDAIKFLPPDRSDGLEFWITNKIRELRDKGDDIKHKIGVVSGKDEMKLTEPNLVPSNMGKPSLQQILTQNFPFYQIVDVDLKAGDSEIDDTLDGIIITQPGKEFTEKELRRIDQFVLKGKSLAVFASAVNVKGSDATMSASLNLYGLDKLLSGYGVEVRKDAVVDFGRSFRVPVMTQGGVASVRFPQVLDVQDDVRFTGDEQLLDTGFSAFFRIPALAFPFASSVVMHEDKQPKDARCNGLKPDQCQFKIVARSTPRSLRETTDTVDLRPFRRWQPKGEWGQYGLAANVEGFLKTAFPEGDKQGVERPDVSKQPARVLVVSSSQFLANPFARAGNGPDMGQMGMMMPGMGGDEQLLQIAGPYAQQALTQTILAFKNTMDWLSGDTDLLAVSAKILQEPHLVYGDVSKPSFAEESEEQLKKRDEEMRKSRKTQQHYVEIVLIVVVPLLFALFGLIRSRLRANARANVSLA